MPVDVRAVRHVRRFWLLFPFASNLLLLRCFLLLFSFFLQKLEDI
jgi:hypothetical protein